MTTYNTGNPIGSTDARDLYDNAQNLDNFVNGASASYSDRLGVIRRSLAGIEATAEGVLNGIGYAVPVAYTSGISLTLTSQTVEYNGVIYAPLSSALPFTTSSWETDSAKFRTVQVTDADLITYTPDAGSPTTIQAHLRAAEKNLALLNVAKPAGLSAAAGGAGNLTGTYTWAVTFVTADGETDCSGETAQLTLASQKANLSNISVSADSRVIARRIYRTVGAPADYVLKKLVGTINDNVTTTFEDNVADGSLGVAVPRTNTTGGEIRLNGVKFGSIAGNTTSLGEGSHPSNTGYANTAFGSYSLGKVTVGYRNTAHGVYALYELTTGDQNTGVGVHAGNDLTTGVGNTYLGYGAGFNTVTGSQNTAVGNSAMLLAPGATSNNTAVGAFSLWLNEQPTGNNTAVGYKAGAEGVTPHHCVFLGAYAGSKITGNDRLVIDAYERSSDTDHLDNSLVYGLFSSSGASAQQLKVNGVIKSENAPLGSLPNTSSEGGAINTNGAWYFSTGASSASENAAVFYNGGALVGVISVSGGTTTTFQSLSDRNAKTNIADASDALQKVQSIKVRKFDWKSTGIHVEHGLIAQELYEVIPDAVGVGDDEKPWMVDASKLIPLLVKAIQELNSEFDAYKAAHP